MVTSIRGFHKQVPTMKNIQALENCELIGAHFDDLQYLYDTLFGDEYCCLPKVNGTILY